MTSLPPLAGMLRAGRQRTGEVSLLVTTPLAFRPPRLAYFLDMVRCFAEMPVRRVTFFILTNTDDPAALRVLDDLLRPFRGPDCIVHVRPLVLDDNPYALCWAHKSLFAEEFLPGDYTHFVYLEDDMRFSLPNLHYFLGAREALRPLGLIPSFVRWEWNAAEQAAFATDQYEQIHEAHVPLLPAGADAVFIPMTSVYCACFVMDHPLALEYMGSRSFDRERSKAVFGWEISERAAMGLAFENAPPSSLSRYRCPVIPSIGAPAQCCSVQHWPANFTADPATPLGKLRMDRIFVPGPSPAG